MDEILSEEKSVRLIQDVERLVAQVHVGRYLNTQVKSLENSRMGQPIRCVNDLG
jgi:hypothetical protein